MKILSKTKNLHVVKDPTRGGVASALMEIADHSKCSIKIFEERLPISSSVKGVCDLVGFDPLYLANEGKFIVICPPKEVHTVQEIFGRACHIIGDVNESARSEVLLEVPTGGIRRLGMLETTQLPRIC